jgi:hypothetical protein
VCCALPVPCSVNSPPFWQATEEKAKKEALKPQRKAERKTVRLADERAAVVEVRRIGQYGADTQPDPIYDLSVRECLSEWALRSQRP